MLPLSEVVLLAAIQGLSEALPLSRSAHDAIAWIWLEPGRSAPALEAILHFGTASALLVGARRRLVAAAGAGLRAVARPSLFRASPPAHDAAVLAVALAASFGARAVLSPFVELWRGAPIAVGFGLVLSGLALGTTALVGKGRAESPSLPMAALLGLGHALGALPGGSDVGAALVIALWIGTKPEIGLDLALLLSGATLAASFFSGLRGAPFQGADLSAAALVLGLVTAFLGATVAIGLLRMLLERRILPLLSFWIIPLAFATISYGRAASEGAETSPLSKASRAALARASCPEEECNRPALSTL